MFRYFESAEIEFMRSLGITYGETNYGLPRVHAECDFLGAIGYDDMIDIEVSLSKLGRSSVRLHFRTEKEGRLLAIGAVVIACMDIATQRAISIPPEMRARLQTAVEPPRRTE
jgi:acyl-CoA thioesterase FadM